MSTNSISIFIDADACPVKSEIERVANRHKIKTYVVSNAVSYTHLRAHET